MHNEDMPSADLPAIKTDIATMKADITAMKGEMPRLATKEDLGAALKPYATKEDLGAALERYASKDDLTQARRELALEMDRGFSSLDSKIERFHEQTSRNISSLMQAVMTIQGMFQRVDNDQLFTRNRLDEHEGRLKALERRRKPS